MMLSSSLISRPHKSNSAFSLIEVVAALFLTGVILVWMVQMRLNEAKAQRDCMKQLKVSRTADRLLGQWYASAFRPKGGSSNLQPEDRADGSVERDHRTERLMHVPILSRGETDLPGVWWRTGPIKPTANSAMGIVRLTFYEPQRLGGNEAPAKNWLTIELAVPIENRLSNETKAPFENTASNFSSKQ